MAKKHFDSLPRAVRPRKNAKPMQDERIDFSDIPESTNEELKRARRVGRPKTGNAKQLIAIRISPRLLAQLRRLAAKRDKPYQTLIHELLEKAARTSKVA
jgi:predicted DNA binding CopG/RHH family protein